MEERGDWGLTCQKVQQNAHIAYAKRGMERYKSFAWNGLEVGGEGGIRTPVPLTRQDAFEAPPLRPLRYLSA